jgi:hypothetical protein
MLTLALGVLILKFSAVNGYKNNKHILAMFMGQSSVFRLSQS